MPATPLDILAEELGAVAGRIEREAGLRIEAAIADLRRIDAERELRLVSLERAVAERLAAIRDGAPGERGPQGASVTLDEVAPVIAAEVAKAVAALPPAEKGAPGERGPAGSSVTLDEVAPAIAAEVAKAVAALPPAEKGAQGERGPQGTMPIAVKWSDDVHYAGAVVTHAGATWQAVRDTGRAPPHDDWVCLAAAGRDGRDGRSFTVRGTFSDEVKDYRFLDVVAMGGAAFVARRDEPGACPGDGWQLIAMQGKRGNPGEPGKSLRGPAGPSVQSLSIDEDALLTLTNADGTTVECDLYPLLSKLAR